MPMVNLECYLTLGCQKLRLVDRQPSGFITLSLLLVSEPLQLPGSQLLFLTDLLFFTDLSIRKSR